MALSRKAKIWLWVAGLPVLLVVLLLIAAKLYFTGDRLKALVVPRIQEATGRTVTLGDIALSVLPGIAVNIDDLVITNPPGALFERSDLLAVKNLRLRISVLELLRGRLDVSAVTISGPRIYLEKAPDGRKNSASGPSNRSGASTDTTAGGGGSSLALVFPSIEIQDGEIESVDRKLDARWRASGLATTFSAVSGPEGRSLRMEGTASVAGFSYGSRSTWYLDSQPAATSLVMTYDLQADRLVLESVRAKLGEVPLEVTGTVTDLSREVIRLDLAVSSPGVQMGQVLSLLPPGMLKQAQGLSSSGEVAFSAKIAGISSDTLNPGISSTFRITNGTIQYASLPKAITQVTIDGSFEKPSAPVGAKGIGSFALQRLSASLGGSTLSGHLSMMDFSDPSVTAALEGAVDLGEVKDYYPLEQGTVLSGSMGANITLEGRVSHPQGLKAGGKVELRNVTVQTASSPRPLRNLNGTIVFNNTAVESQQLSLLVGESDLRLTFALRNYLALVLPQPDKASGSPRATVRITSRQLRTADLVSEKSPAETPSPAETGSLRPQSVILPGVDLDATLAVDRLVTDKFTFENVKGSLALIGGVATLKDLSLNAFQGSIQTKGTLDLRGAARRPFNLDLAINSVEAGSFLPNFTSFGKYLTGKLNLTTKMAGDLNDTLGLEPQTLLGNGAVKVSEGKLLGLPLAQKLASFTNINELRDIAFRDWTNAFSVSDGRLVVKDLKITAGETTFLVGGSQGLDGSLDYSLKVNLPQSLSDRIQLPGVAGDLLQFFKDKEGRMALSFAVTGTSAEPALRLDTKAQEDAVKKSLEQKARQTLEDALKKKAREGLQNLLKRP